MKIENTEVYGMEAAVRSMRNPMDSWDRSDSTHNPFIMGPNDLKLLKSLTKAGSEHRKCLRMVWVWVDLTLSRSVLTQLDTYKIATCRMSCSTMHKLGYRDLTPDDFEDQEVTPEALKDLNDLSEQMRHFKLIKDTISATETLIKLKRHLPEGYLQKGTFNFNYETLMNIYHQRNGHRVPEFSGYNGICEWIEQLPYMAELLSVFDE